MTFTDALSHKVPVRRREWTRPDGARINYETVFGPQWITLGVKKDGMTRQRYPWIVTATGAEITLQYEDYVAEDWEVQTP